MLSWNRRRWMKTLGVSAFSLPFSSRVNLTQSKEKQINSDRGDLPLTQFEPRSMLHIPQSEIAQPRFPVIDFHSHLGWSPGIGQDAPQGGKMVPTAPLGEILNIMNRSGLKMMVNLTGGFGNCLRQAVDYFHKPAPDRIVVFTEPWWHRTPEKGYPKFQADELEKARQMGARGLKVAKTLGLYLRENLTRGKLVKVDDPRFDPMWETAGSLKMPVIIHVSDPEAFFLPVDRFNERYEELHAHPDWSYYGDFPSNQELHEARNRVVARHPKTQFVLCHAGNSENLAWVSEWLDRYPNMQVDFSARIGELGRQPRASRRFFEKYQDRIVFGTDAIPHENNYPQQGFGELLYQVYYRFLETEDEYFDYAPAKVPPQGRWRIYGIGLPEPILRKVYHDNAARLLGMLSL
jgi:predicted TIM-barrel fold metal-dependent hydrolase